MKKVLILLMMAISLLFTSPVFAEEEAKKESSSKKIEISFKVGDETLKVNSKDIKVEKPYVTENGVTLVPLRVITEAFGAEVAWNGEQQSITLKYNGVVIKLIIDSDKAQVDGKEVTIQEAPVIINGNTMVPLRFITENFGSDVKYDDKTRQITITKEIASSNSIRDFGLLLKKTSRDKVGDSYYNWSISLPKKLKIQYREFNGSLTFFEADDKSYALSVYMTKQKDATLDSLIKNILEYTKSYTIISQDKLKKSGEEYYKIVYKKDGTIYERRVFLRGGQAYTVLISVKDYDKYKSNTEYSNIMDSFSLSFNKDGSTEDLSDVNNGGFRVYEDKKLKWALTVPAEWKDMKTKDQENRILFKDENNSTFFFDMYSIENGMTLDSWVESEVNDLTDSFSSQAVKILSKSDEQINGVKCKKITTHFKYDSTDIYQCDIFMLGKNYRYRFGYNMKANEYNDGITKIKADVMTNSFKFSEPKVEDIGKIIDPDKIVTVETKRKFESSDFKWSVELSDDWSEIKDTKKDSKSYENAKKGYVLYLASVKGSQIDLFKEGFESYLTKENGNSNTTITQKEDISDKGVSVRKYTINTVNDKKVSVRQYVYIFTKNNYIHAVIIGLPEFRCSEKNVKAMDELWKSIKFE